MLEPDTFDRIPKDTPYSIERGYFPSLVARGETFCAYVERGYWIDIGTPEKYRDVHKDIFDGRCPLGPAGIASGQPVVSPEARVEAGAVLDGPCFLDAGVVVKAGARIGPYTVLGRSVLVEEDAQVTGAIVWPNARIGHDAVVDGALIGRSCYVGKNAVVGPAAILGDKTTLVGLHPRLTRRRFRERPPRMTTINPEIFKAYDVRGLYPSEVNEETFLQLGRAFAVFLGPGRVAVTRDMRLSSPSLTAAFIDGVTRQGVHVVDCGLAGTDMMYFAVAANGFDGGAQITASHNPKQYNGCKLVRREAFPLSGESGIKEMREMMMTGALPPPAATRGTVTTLEVMAPYLEHVMGFIDPTVIHDFKTVLDAGSGIAGLVAPHLFDRLPCRTTRLCFEVDGTFPNHEANPLLEENRADIMAEVIRQQADIGIAWDGDADRCFFIDGSGEFIAGDFITALLAEAALMKQPRLDHHLRRARQLRGERHRGPLRRAGAHEPRRPCLHQAPDAGGRRDLRRRSDRPLLLQGQLLRRQRLHPGAAHPGADVAQGQAAPRPAGAAAREVLHFRRDQHQGLEHGRRAREDRAPGQGIRGTDTSIASTASQ